MTILIIAVLIVLFIAWGRKLNKKQAATPLPTLQVQPPASSSTDFPTLTLTSTFGYDELFAPGTLKPVAGKPREWTLERKGFAITLINADEAAATELKSTLDANLSMGLYSIGYAAESVVSKKNLRVKEIDEYVAKMRPIIEARIQEIASNDPEWRDASELNREAILSEAKERAYAELTETPYGSLEDLIEGESADPTLDDRLYEKYSPQAVSAYQTYADKVGKVYRIAADHYNRSNFDELVKFKLAQQGSTIPMQNIIESLTLKQMNEIRDESTNPKAFARKATGVDALLAYADIRERVEKLIPTRELFQILPADSDLSPEQLAELARANRYDHALGSSIAYAYVMGSLIEKEIQFEQQSALGT